MTERSRHRLIGIASMLAVLIIVGPALFDGAGIAPPAEPKTSVPAVEVAPPPRLDTRGSDWAFVEDLDELRNADGHQTPDADGSSPALGLPRHEALDDPALVGRPAFTIQIATFESADNARALRNRLLKAGYPAYLVPVRTAAGEAMVRVAVGPYIDRAQASTIQREVSKSMGFEGLLRRYSL